VDACWIPIRDPKTEEVSIFNGFWIYKRCQASQYFAIYDGLARIKAKSGAELDAIKKSTEGLPLVELPKGTKVESKEKENFLRYEPVLAQKTVAELAQKFSKKKPNTKDIEKISQELLGELQPQITLALAGQVYAYFLRSSDLVVSEDPLLLRKHHYFNFDSEIAESSCSRNPVLTRVVRVSEVTLSAVLLNLRWQPATPPGSDGKPGDRAVKNPSPP